MQFMMWFVDVEVDESVKKIFGRKGKQLVRMEIREWNANTVFLFILFRSWGYSSYHFIKFYHKLTYSQTVNMENTNWQCVGIESCMLLVLPSSQASSCRHGSEMDLSWINTVWVCLIPGPSMTLQTKWKRNPDQNITMDFLKSVTHGASKVNELDMLRMNDRELYHSLWYHLSLVMRPTVW